MFQICERQRRFEVKRQFDQGLHFVGEWHTHAEKDPTPSQVDLNSMRDAFVRSSHELNYFVMAIVGNRSEQLSLWISIHNAHEAHRLHEK
jgi:integrative and conjugative element protein (TIGR02256 family)